jgi:DNA polymerase-3 subunit epsilon
MAIPLNELLVLALDCQATGANPQKGHLLEIGWIQTSAMAAVADEMLPARSFLVRLPADAAIPAAVARITGITAADKHQAFEAADIRRELLQTARSIAAADQMDACPTIIHYARFEKPFLKHLCGHEHHPGAFPLQIICTHSIAKRLLPGLPRRGLRAVAGYFGYAVPQRRRSADHARGTAVIWQNFVRKLAAQHGIRDLDQLTAWLKLPTPQSPIRRTYPMDRELRCNLPDKPGIYRMRRANGDLLYIGKATSLRQRVNSYFSRKGTRAEHTLEMLSQAAKLDVTPTGSALEAAVLESDEIKRHCPPYNIALQPGQRKLVFCSEDLQSCSVEPDRIHRIGPLPEGNTGAALNAFGAWHKNSRTSAADDLLRIGYAILAVPEAYGPPPDCLLEGLALFRRNHRARLSQPVSLRIITGLGFMLWQERLAALEKIHSSAANEPLAAPPDDRQPAAEETPRWTPEAVARGIEKFAMHSAHLIRRSRWLCLLSESSLAWEMRDSKSHSKTVLLLESGAVCHREQLPLSEKTPVSRGYIKRMAGRQKIFDLTTYERLRVLTTELRRLAAEGRKMEIRLSPRAILSQRQLARILPWV